MLITGKVNVQECTKPQRLYSLRGLLFSPFEGTKKKHNNNIENHLSVFSFIGICINNTKESMIQTVFFDKLGLSFVLLNSHLSEIISQAYSINKIAGIWYGVSTESAHIKFLCFPIRIEISSTAFQQKI